MNVRPISSLNSLDPETIYQIGFEGRWSDVIDLLRRNRDVVRADERLKETFEQTLQGFFFESWDDLDVHILNDWLEKLHILHVSGVITLVDPQSRRIVSWLVRRFQETDLRKAYTYARFYPDMDECRTVISAYETTAPTEVRHRRPGNWTVTTNAPDAVDHTTGLFKSKQEELFFRAVRAVFPTFAVYPNVAMSSILDYNALKPIMSEEERSYFFRAVIDCVVFDQHNQYRPVYFFELDSRYHDQAGRRKKDRMKDHILALAGRHLYRIRTSEQAEQPEAFIPIIQDLVES